MKPRFETPEFIQITYMEPVNARSCISQTELNRNTTASHLLLNERQETICLTKQDVAFNIVSFMTFNYISITML